MKKLIICATIMVLGANFLNGQTPSDTYVILTSTPYCRDVNDDDGIFKVVSDNYPIVTYVFKSSSKGVYFRLRHTNMRSLIYPHKEMQIVTLPISFLDEIAPIDFDKIWPVMTKEKAGEFCDGIKGELIWLIDRNDITDTHVKLLHIEVPRREMI